MSWNGISVTTTLNCESNDNILETFTSNLIKIIGRYALQVNLCLLQDYPLLNRTKSQVNVLNIYISRNSFNERERERKREGER